jgi:hypothetical protein
MSRLEQAIAAHEQRLMLHVDELPKLADGIYLLSRPALLERVDAERAFIARTLLTHLRVVETTIHCHLDRTCTCTRTLEGLRAEHRVIRGLASRLDEIATRRPLEPADVNELDAVLTALYLRLRAHLREESRCLLVLEDSLSAGEIDALVSAMDEAYVSAA